MRNENNNKTEQPIRFVARKYREGSLDAGTAWKRFAAKQGIGRRFSLYRSLAGVAAVLLIIIGIGTVYTMGKDKPEWVVIVAEAGLAKEVFLPDSSVVVLAASSEVSYDRKTYGKDARVVKMRGKAFYEVARDEACPFSVQTKETTVTVLGTSFQVAELDLITEIFVQSGKVAFAADEQQVVLTAGMTASYAEGTRRISIDEKETEAANTLSWKTNNLKFADTPLDQVIHDLNRHYQKTIFNNSEQAGDLKLTATFSSMPLEDVLFIINQTLDIELKVSSNK